MDQEVVVGADNSSTETHGPSDHYQQAESLLPTGQSKSADEDKITTRCNIDDSVSRNEENVVRRACKSILHFPDHLAHRIRRSYKCYRNPIRYLIGIILLSLYGAYFVYACYRDISAASALVVITALVTAYVVFSLIRRCKATERCTQVIGQFIDRYLKKTSPYAKWVVCSALALALVIFLILDTWRNPGNLRSAAALLIFIIVLLFTSRHKTQVKWRPVVCGLGLQLLLGLVIVRWPYGYKAFKFLGDQVAVFAGYTDKGSITVFGEKYLDHPVAFKILPCIVFFSCVTNILYYLGCIQRLIQSLGGFMRVTMGTSAVESLNAAASIFLGPLECTLMLRPFIDTLTSSELNAVMTAGFSTVAGTVVAAYIEFGAPAEHVVAASIMSAPAALAIAKLQVPETEQPVGHHEVELGISKDRNIIDAACQGAISSAKLVTAVVVSIIGFLGILAFVDATLSYCGGLVGYPQLSFEVISSFVFMPLAYMIGIEWNEAGTVGGLIGTKICFTEFIAFQQMHELIKQGRLSTRSVSITTYLLTGFGSIVSVGMYVGVLMSVVPSRKQDFSATGIRAVIGGNVACFMTAAICGLLYQGSELEESAMRNVTVLPTAEILNVTTSTHFP